MALEFRYINHTATAGLKEKSKVFDVERPVDAAVILKYPAAQCAVDKKNLRDGNPPGIEKVVDIMGKDPIPMGIPKCFFDR